jgi:hypothetical protein
MADFIADIVDPADITPTTDTVNLALLLGSMILLYFIIIGFSFLALFSKKGKVSKPGNKGPIF